MQLDIIGQDIEITDVLRDFLHTIFAKLTQHLERINSIYIVLQVEKVAQIADATLHVNGGELHASAEDQDIYATIDGLIEKLARQLTKPKDKLKNIDNPGIACALSARCFR